MVEGYVLSLCVNYSASSWYFQFTISVACYIYLHRTMLITEQNQDLLMDISGMFLPDLSHTDDTFGYGKSASLFTVLLSLYYSISFCRHNIYSAFSIWIILDFPYSVVKHDSYRPLLWNSSAVFIDHFVSTSCVVCEFNV